MYVLARAGSRAELNVSTNSVGWAWKPKRCNDVTEGGAPGVTSGDGGMTTTPSVLLVGAGSY